MNNNDLFFFTDVNSFSHFARRQKIAVKAIISLFYSRYTVARNTIENKDSSEDATSPQGLE